MGKIINTYKNMSLMAKASIWFVFCSLMQKGISTITVPIFTRLLSTAEYGTYSLYLSWFNILTIFTSLNMYYGVFNNALNRIKEPSKRDVYVSSMQGLTITLTLVLAVIYFPLQGFWSDLLGLNKLALAMMLVHLMVEPSVQFWLARQRFEYKYKHAVALTMVKNILNPLLGLVFVFAADSDKATARIASVVVAEVIIAGSVMLFQFCRGKCFFKKEHWKYALSFNVPLIPHYLSAVLLNQADRVMIQHYVGKAEVGIYSVAYNIGMLVQLFTNAINNSLTPWTYEKLNNRDYKSIRKNTNYLLLSLALAICCVLLFVPEVVALFATEAYYDAIYVIPPIACSVYFVFLYNIFAIPQMYYERQKFMSVASMIAAGLNIALNAIFIPIFGYFAAGYTTVACYLLYSIGHYVFSRKVCMDKIGNMDLYDEKMILAISMGVLACSIGFNFLYRFNFIRYGLFLVIAVFAVIKKNAIVDMMKNIKRR